MRAEVKQWWSEPVQVTGDGVGHALVVQADIGPVGSPGGDTFSFELCTPEHLAERLAADGRPFWARARLVATSLDHSAIDQALAQLVGSVAGDTWLSVADQLARFLDWEFEGYRGHA